MDEQGKSQRLFLFEHTGSFEHLGSFRTVKLVASQALKHTHHLLEPAKQLRREQPGERFQVLCEAEVKKRQTSVDGKVKLGKRAISLDDMKIRVDAVIESRAKNEADDVAPLNGAEEDASELPGSLVPVATLEAELLDQGQPAHKLAAAKRKAAANKRAASAKASSAKAAPARPAKKAKLEKPAQEPDFEPACSSSNTIDELADKIAAKTGSDPKAVRNLDVTRILAGEQLGRTLQGATWLPVSTITTIGFGQA